MAKEDKTPTATTTAVAAAVAAATAAPKEGDVILKDEPIAPIDAVEPEPEPEPDWTPPVIDEVGPVTEQPVTPTPTEPTEPAPGPDVSLEVEKGEASLDEVPNVVPGPEMVADGGSAVTNIMLRRIEKHLRHLKGEVGFASIEEQRLEQVSFIETVGESTSLDFEKFKIVTDALIRMIVDNKELFRSGEALRFLKNLQGHYSQQSVNRYTDYVTFLTKIAVNWTNRARLRQQTDIATVIADLREVGKQNVTMYFNTLVAAR
ncbi:hypothetical protein D3C79_47640 [compost metagenome]